MVLKLIVPIALGAALLSGSSVLAADYRPEEFLQLDLPRAVLSPKLLGPEAHFEAVPVQAKADQKADQKSDQKADQAADRNADQKPANQMADQKPPEQAVAAARPQASRTVRRRIATPRVRVARHIERPPIERPHGAVRTKLAHRHGNPLDAQAMDSRIQTWPCKPGNGGICAWR